MNPFNSKRLPTWVNVFIKTNFSKIEYILASIALISWVFKYLNVLDLNFLIVLSLSSLALLYFISAFLRPALNDDKPLKLITNKALHYSWSVSIIALLFKIFQYPNSETMMNIGLYSSAFAMLFIILTSYKDLNQKLRNALVRTILIDALLLFLPV